MTRHPFTLTLAIALGLAAFALAAPVARADRVVLLPPTGTAPQERLDDVEEALERAITASGHAAVTEAGAVNTAGAAPPTTANEMAAVAEMQNAQFLVVPRVTHLSGRYELFLRVGYAPSIRVEELRVTVVDAEQDERLADVLRAMLRPEGLGDDAVRLTEEPSADAEAEAARRAEEERLRQEEEERLRQEEEARARGEFEEREQERAEEARLREEEAWEGRERYGTREGRPWMASVGLDFRPLFAHDAEREGGVMTGASIHLGRAIDAVPGLELRGSFDIVTGATSGFAVAGGAAYLLSPFADLPVFIGGIVEVGGLQALTGNRVPSFLLRASPVVVWRVADNIYLEGVAPEFQYLSANGGAASLGFSIRVGLRF